MDFDFFMEYNDEGSALINPQAKNGSLVDGLKEESKEIVYGMKDAVIFLVDCQALLFQNENIQASNVEILKEAYLGLMKRKVVFHSGDKVGLILYNSGMKRNMLDFEGIFVLDELDNVSADKIKQGQKLEKSLENLLANPSSSSKLVEVANLSKLDSVI